MKGNNKANAGTGEPLTRAQVAKKLCERLGLSQVKMLALLKELNLQSPVQALKMLREFIPRGRITPPVLVAAAVLQRGHAAMPKDEPSSPPTVGGFPPPSPRT